MELTGVHRKVHSGCHAREGYRGSVLGLLSMRPSLAEEVRRKAPALCWLQNSLLGSAPVRQTQNCWRNEMRKSQVLCAVLLLSMSAFATTTINNFTGYNDGYYPFGDPNTATQTYGEVFTAPDGVNTLSNFSFYMGDPLIAGNIITGAYIATWTGSHAGTLLYSSGAFNYDNLGNEQLTFNPSALFITSGQQYVMFLSTSEFHGQSSGEAFVSTGSSDPNLNGFAYFNNGPGFDNLFTNPWDGSGLSPDWAVGLQFDQTPEPSTLVFVGTGILGGLGMLRRKLF